MLALILAGMLGVQSDDADKQIDFLRFSYKANKDSFSFGTFRFQFTTGSSQSLSEATSDHFSKSINEDGFYMFDGRSARYDLTVEPKNLAAATTRIDERRSTSFAVAFRMLTDGKVTLRDMLSPNQAGTELRHRPAIRPGTADFYRSGFFEFPLYIGDGDVCDYNLYTDLTAIKDGKITLDELNFNASLDGRRVCKFAFTWKDGKRSYWIDLDRGTVPLLIVDHNNLNNVDVHMIHGDLEHVQNAGWLPRRRIHIVGNGQVVDRIVVTDIDTKHKPAASAFQLDFPEAVVLVDAARKLVYPRRKTWSLLSLPGPTSPGTRPATPRSYIPPHELPGEAESGSGRIAGILLLTVLILCSIGLLILMKRRNRGSRGG